jgi:hypothetical protein
MTEQQISLVLVFISNGFNQNWIATNFGLTYKKVKELVDKNGGADKLLCVPEVLNESGVFPSLVSLLAKVSYDNSYLKLYGRESITFMNDSIKKTQMIKNFLMELRGMELSAEILTLPGYLHSQRGYGFLLGAILGIKASDFSILEDLSDYLLDVYKGNIPLPNNLSDACRVIGRSFFHKIRYDILPAWSDDAKKVFDEIIVILATHEQKVIKSHFGLVDGVRTVMC